MTKGFSSSNKKNRETKPIAELEKEATIMALNGKHREAQEILDTKIQKSKTREDKAKLRLIKGNLYVLLQQWDKAIQQYQKHYSCNPEELTDTFKRNLFGKAATSGQEQRNLESLRLHCQFLSIEPKHANALRNFALVLRRTGALMDAEKYANRHLQIIPDSAEGYVTLSTIVSDQGRFDEAFRYLQKAITIDPNNSNAIINLAGLYHIARDLDNAYLMSAKACALDTTNICVWLDALTSMKRVCAFERLNRIDWWKMLETLPKANISSSFLQFLTLTESENDIKRFKLITKTWGVNTSSMYKNKQSFSEAKREINNKPIIVGFISADFRDHSVSRFILHLFMNAQRLGLELYAYGTQDVNDAYTKKFRAYARQYRYIGNENATKLAEIIREDKVDVLFDITGFTNGGRIAMLSQRLAPVQISWLGFPGSIGLPEIDYLLLDEHLAPKSKDYINEQLLTMEGSSICFSGMEEVQITKKLPEEVRGYITFGSLNNPYKFNPKTISLWAKTMRRVNNSRILLVRPEYKSFHLRANLIKEFEKYEVTKDQIHFYDNDSKNRNYLDCYNEIDISLDTFPLTGGTTTIDALWMGVPVITLEGIAIHQRISSSILHQIDLKEAIADDENDFIQKAVSLATNRMRRKTLRMSLRKKIKHSKLCDTDAFADNFKKAICKTLIASSDKYK